MEVKLNIERNQCWLDTLKSEWQYTRLDKMESEFSEYETFKRLLDCFGRRINRDRRAGGRIGELFFALLIAEIINKNKYSGEVYMHSRDISNKPYVVKVDCKEYQIHKEFDIYICKNCSPQILVEVKKNIDNIEKDLIKAYLHGESKQENKPKFIEIVWEEKDESKSRRGEDNQYMILLKYFIGKGLDAFFYFYGPTDENDKKAKENFENEVKRLDDFLRDSLKDR
jgi:hypothetical protein